MAPARCLVIAGPNLVGEPLKGSKKMRKILITASNTGNGTVAQQAVSLAAVGSVMIN